MFVRLFLSNPRPGQRDEVLALADDLLSFFSAQPGFIDGYRLTTAEQIGGVTIWESETMADHAANSQHSLALLSELRPMIAAEPLGLGLEGLQVKKQP